MSRKHAWIAAQIVFLTIAGWYFASDVSKEWDQVSGLSAELRPNWWRIAKSALWVMAGYAVLIETWRQTVLAWGARLSWPAASRIWFISNLGRYIPGKVWQIGAMSTLAQRSGVSGVAAVGSALVVNLVNVLAACLVVMLAGARQLAGPGFIAGLIAFTIAVFLSPWILPVAVRLMNRTMRWEIGIPKIPPLAIVFAVAGCALAWNLYGIAFRELAWGLFGEATGRTSSYTAVFTLSYLLGYLAPFAPGGLGVREAALTKLLPLAGLETGAHAVVLVLVSRLWLTILEAAPGLLLLAASRLSNRTDPAHG